MRAANKFRPWMRIAILFATVLQTAAAITFFGIVACSGQLFSAEALSREIARGMLLIYGLPYLICVPPAMVLAAFNRALPIALALSILAIAAVFVSYHYA